MVQASYMLCLFEDFCLGLSFFETIRTRAQYDDSDKYIFANNDS
ncbi:hypothetical protein HMPREF0868_0133 [Mageeibacillus indolicus UPII9-5]|uniref:Uncharacterized protein n=1 Tax=Mageeibacillus indolicus (strain UPII9-5) TaxID=699246 RepID=D3QZX4_MAGIU|nr:hypothetical protein HMPREF0868_0133 [Mageeibacillus indolicus UPII9-5]